MTLAKAIYLEYRRHLQSSNVFLTKAAERVLRMPTQFLRNAHTLGLGFSPGPVP